MVIFALVQLVIGGFFWWLIERSKDPKNRIETTGQLISYEVRKDVPGKRGRRHTVFRRVIRWSYSYTINGHTHKLRGESIEPNRRPRPEEQIVCLRGFPRMAYLKEWTGQRELIWALFLSFSGTICLLLAGFLALL